MKVNDQLLSRAVADKARNQVVLLSPYGQLACAAALLEGDHLGRVRARLGLRLGLGLGLGLWLGRVRVVMPSDHRLAEQLLPRQRRQRRARRQWRHAAGGTHPRGRRGGGWRARSAPPRGLLRGPAPIHVTPRRTLRRAAAVGRTTVGRRATVSRWTTVSRRALIRGASGSSGLRSAALSPVGRCALASER